MDFVDETSQKDAGWCWRVDRESQSGCKVLCHGSFRKGDCFISVRLCSEDLVISMVLRIVWTKRYIPRQMFVPATDYYLHVGLRRRNARRKSVEVVVWSFALYSKPETLPTDKARNVRLTALRLSG